MPVIQVERLTSDDIERARDLFTTIAGVFETETSPLSDGYLKRLLMRNDFWALAVSIEGRIVGGLTAFTLPLTRLEASEIFIYDIAVRPDHQRQGIGRRLIETLRAQASAAGVEVAWVPADNEDTHALDFYRALGGEPAPVTVFTFSD